MKVKVKTLRETNPYLKMLDEMALKKMVKRSTVSSSGVEGIRIDHKCHFCGENIDLARDMNTYVLDEMQKYGHDRYFCSYRCVLEHSGCEDSLGSRQEENEDE